MHVLKWLLITAKSDIILLSKRGFALITYIIFVTTFDGIPVFINIQLLFLFHAFLLIFMLCTISTCREDALD